MGVAEATRNGVIDFLKLICGDVAVFKQGGSGRNGSSSSSRSSRRGEHVINLSVLTIHRDILEHFLRDSGLRCAPYQGIMNRILAEDFFGDDIRSVIEEATVHFDSSESYMDENSIQIGRAHV